MSKPILIRATPNKNQSGPPYLMIDLCITDERGKSHVYGSVDCELFRWNDDIGHRLYDVGLPVLLEIRMAGEGE